MAGGVFPWSNGSGGTSGSGTGNKTAAASPVLTENKVVQLAGRLIAQDPTNSALTQDRLKNAFQGYAPADVSRIGKSVGLSGLVLKGLVNNAKGRASKEQIPGEGFAGGIGSVLWALDRPAQAVLGGISEGGSGAVKGFTGQEAYTPVQAWNRGINNMSKEEAAAAEKRLGGWATPLNIAGSAAVDPFTYVSFGGTAVGRAAAEHAAEVTGVSVKDILQSGTKALTKDQLKAATEEAGKTLLTRRNEGVKALQGAPGGIKIGGKTIINTRKLTGGLGEKLGQRYEKSALSNIGDPLEAAFRNESAVRQAARSGESWAQGVPDQLSAIWAGARGRQALSADEAMATAKLALRGNRITKSQFGAIRDMLEKDPTRILKPDEAQAAIDIRRIHDETLGAEHAAGVPTPRLGEGGVAAIEKRLNARGQNPIADAIRRGNDPTIKDPLLMKAQAAEQQAGGSYLEHVPVDRAASRTASKGQGGGPLGYNAPGFAQQRTIPGSIREINQKVQEGVLGKSARMEPDLAKVTLHRQLGSAASVNHQQTVDALLAVKGGDGEGIFRRLAGEPKNVPAGFEHIKLRDPGPGGGDAHYLVRQEIAGDVARHFQNLSSDETLRQMRNLIDTYNRFWKRYAVATPGFISRNVQSNLYAASFLPEAGFRATPLDYFRAGRLQMKVKEGLKESGDAFAKLSPEETDAFRAANDSGALQGLFTPSDISRQPRATTRIRDELAGGHLGEVAKRVGARVNPLGPDFLPTSALRTANSTFEDNARLALFLHNRGALGDKGAAKVVFKYLFDYNDLTPFEQQTLKRVSPFMTWTRKNVPLQLETALKNPGRFSRIQQVRDEVNRQAGPIKNLPVPSYIGEDAGVKWPGELPFGMGKEGVLTPDLPYRSAGDALTPLVKVLQSVPGLVNHGQLDTRALGQLISNNTGGAAGLLPGLVELATRQNLFTGQNYKPGAQTDTVLGKMDPSAYNFLEKLAPGVLQRAKTIFPANPGDEAAQTRRILSSLLGTGLTPLNAKTRQSALYEQLAALQAQQQKLKDTGQTVPVLKDVPGYTAPKKKKGSSSNSGGGGGIFPWSK